MSTRVILFDLGETLVAYCRGPVFAGLLPDCLDGAARSIRDLRPGLRLAPVESTRIEDVNHERSDYRVTPLLTRLAHVFQADLTDLDPSEAAAVGSAFVAPISAIASVYADTLATLDELLGRGLRLGLVSNTPWGSPAGPWRAEMSRHGLGRYFEHAIFCVDVGWRKPAPAPFLAALERFAETPENCLFVGDRPDWDVDGARLVGMRALLIDRDASNPEFTGPKIDHLAAILEHL